MQPAVIDEALVAPSDRPIGFVRAIGRHPRRAFSGGVRKLRPTAAEQRAMEAAGIVDPLMQRFVAWRRSLLIVATPITLFTGCLAVWDLTTNLDTTNLTSFGSVINFVPLLAVLVLMVGTVFATATWRSLRRSARTLLTAWVISIVSPLFIAVLPIDWLISERAMNEFQGGPDGVRIYYSVVYAIILLPTLLSFPSGVVRGAARIKSLLPSSTLAGWVLLILAPIYAVFFVVAVIIVQQLAGNGLLLTGIVLLAASPFVHVFAARLYILPLGSDAEVRRLDNVQRRAGLLTLAGGALILLWALTARFGDSRLIGSGDALVDHKAAILRAVELIARVLVTTAVFSHLLLQITEANWRHDRGFADPEHFQRHEQQMAQVERTLRAAGDQVD